MAEKENKPLIIPENCPPKDYLINGFTKNDAAWISGIALIGAVGAVMIYTSSGNSIIAVVIFFLVVVIAINIFRRDAATENLLDKLRIIRDYKNVPKTYEYKYVNIWEIEKNDKGRSKK